MQGKRRGMIDVLIVTWCDVEVDKAVFIVTWCDVEVDKAVFIVTWCDVEVDKAFRENKDMAE